MIQATKAKREWEQLLSEQQESGKSIAEFSRERGIDLKRLYGMRQRYELSVPAAKFARVQTAITVNIELASGIKIQASLESLNAVLRELAVK